MNTTSSSNKSPTNDNELAQRLALWNMPGVGPATFFKLINKSDTLSELFNASHSTLRHWGVPEKIATQLRRPDWSIVEGDLAWQAQSQHHIICWDDADYPVLLKEISSPPPILFVRGQRHALNTPQIALVGSRNPTPTGKENAYHFAHHLAQNGYTITSGLAIGIDTASHHGALAAGGLTLGVLGTGIEHVYPRSNQQLAATLIANGALISEFGRTTPPNAKNFPRRNRVISGLSTGVLVIEAAVKSGSLISAHYANEQNREVFAIPGSIHNPLARGCHALIRQGAHLVETADDIIQELATLTHVVTQQAFTDNLPADLDNDHQKLVKCIGYEATSLDVMLQRCDISPQNITQLLLELEMRGVITSTTGGYMRT